MTYLVDVQPPYVFDAIAEDGWRRRKSVTYITRGNQGNISFFVDFQDSSTMVVHDGPNNSAPVIGTIDMHMRTSKTNFTLKADSVTGQAIQQTFDRSGIFDRTSSCRIPAIKGDARAIYTWKRTSDHGASAWKPGSQVLVDETGQEHAAYVSHTGLNVREGELKILNPALSPEAIQQIVVSCTAIQEINRRKRQSANASAAGASASSASASAAASVAC